MRVGLETTISQHGENRFLSLVMRSLRPSRRATRKGFGWYTIPIRYAGRPTDMPFLFIPSRGCRFDYSGACTMCNFGAGAMTSDVDIVEFVCRQASAHRNSPCIFITTSGSFLDDSEISPSLRLELLSLLGSLGYQTIATESRPEFITESSVRLARSALSSAVELEIGIGVESANPWIRRNCVNKMLSDSEIDRAIAACHDTGASVYVHVLLKPPFLCEGEAVADATETLIRYHSAGADRLGVGLMSVKANTLTHWLWQRGMYEPPTYWSAAAVIKRLPEAIRGSVGLFGFDSSTPVTVFSGNCTSCGETARKLLFDFCHRAAIDPIESLLGLDCTCRAHWEQTMHPPDEPLRLRVARSYSSIAEGIFGEPWWLANRQWIEIELDTDPSAPCHVVQ